MHNGANKKGKNKKGSSKRRHRLIRKHRRPPVGSRPGTLVGDNSKEATVITLIDYSEQHLEQKVIDDLKELPAFRNSDSVSWINIEKLSDLPTLEKIAEIFGIHHLTLADAVNIPSRPKSEFYEDGVFVITDMVAMTKEKGIVHEQLSLFFAPGILITFQERPGDVLDPVRARISNAKGSIRKRGSDHLAIAVIDTIIDAYFPVLEQLGETLENLEDEVIHNSSETTIADIHHARRDLIAIRRALWPLREAVSGLLREDHPAIQHENKMYLRDCYEHTVQLLDIVESYRELCSGLIDVYLSSVSNRLNEVMKVLTIISTIFIPLSFFASVYGMNFKHLPELNWRYGYLYFWLSAVTVVTLMVYSFTKAGWIKIPRWIKPDQS